MATPFSHSNIVEIFGADAADLEEPARLWTFFVENESYGEVRAPYPITLVVGQKGIGKTALMLVSSFEDSREKTPNIFLKGYQILGASSDSESGAQSIEKFKEIIQSSIVDHILKRLSQEAAESVGMPPFAGNILATIARIGAVIATGQSTALKDASKKITPWLSGTIKTLNIYIDDTDIEWNGSTKSANKVSNLIQACFQLAADSKGDVHFKISLRSDLFNFLSVSSDLIDKIQGGVVRCRWTNDQIFRVIAKRIATYEDVEYDDISVENLEQEEVFRQYFLTFFDDKFNDVGAWENAPMRQVLLSFIRQRPRDLIGLCQLAARTALHNDSKINTTALKSVISEYSKNRFNDTVVEFRNEVPEVEALLYEMRSPERKKGKKGDPAPKHGRHYYTHDQLMVKIGDIRQRINVRFSYQSAPAKSMDIAEFLFRINFLIASRTESDGKMERMYYDFADKRLREVRSGMWDWEVHPAYRWAIQHDEEAVWREIAR